MQEVRTEIEIEASPERVWRLLTDFESFPRWNPFIRWANGNAQVGEALEVHQRLPGGEGTTLWPTVLKVEPEHELRWLGHGLRPGLFDDEHIFTIEPVGPNRVRFVHRQRFDGALVPLVWRSLEADTRRGLEAMNQALKERAES